MTATALIGLQWGDEGKGKMVDILAHEVDCVVRCQGGSNAGHTVYVGSEKTVLHLVPSGILVDGTDCVIGNGVVVDPDQLIAEIDDIERRGVRVRGRLFVSDRAHVVLPWHKLLDRAQEEARGAAGIGTTRRGIGPSYEDKVSRSGLRLGDLWRKATLSTKLEAALEEKRRRLGGLASELSTLNDLLAKCEAWTKRLEGYLADTFTLLRDYSRAKKSFLLEGAQGSLLDVDLGSYPYVTSSNTNVGGLLSGSGVSPRDLSRIIGVAKAYSTRVGSGPYPTELFDAVGNRLRERGKEFGATTGRPRRCGWYDAVAARFAVEANGISSIALTKIDILSGFPTLKVCTAYRLDGKTISDWPSSTDDLARVEPVFEELPGWTDEIGACRRYTDLPAATRNYIEYLERVSGAVIEWVSVGPTRDAVISRGK